MAALPGPSPLAADELLFRRVPAKPEFYDPSTGVLELAFKPTVNDADGLSLSRQQVGPAGAAATGPMGRSFYVARFRLADLTSLGLTVVADRDDHAVIAELTHAARQSKDPATRQRLATLYGQLVRAVMDVDGPFPGLAVPPTAPPPPSSPA